MVQLLTDESVSTLSDNLIQQIEKLRHEKKFVAFYKKYLGDEYQVSPGHVQSIINNTFKIKELTTQELYIFSLAMYEFIEKDEVNPDNYYPKRLAKEIMSEFKGDVEESISFPYTFYGIERVAEDDFIGTIKASEIKQLMDNHLIQYNFNTQREAKLKRNVKTNEIIPVPKVKESSVNEISKLMESGDLISSLITFNARVGTADSGEEVIYNDEDKSLTITEGTLLDCLDGFHRISGITKALLHNPDLEMVFKLNILNFTVEKARHYFAQTNTTNPVSKAHVEKFAKKNLSTFVIEQLELTSELKNRVSTHFYTNRQHLVTFKTLSEGIDENWDLDNKVEALKLSKYLKSFFNTLFYSFPDEFLDMENEKSSLMPTNRMFYGYLLLAKRMQEESIPVESLEDILSQLDFSENGKTFKQLGTKSSNSKNVAIIKRIFNDLNLEI